MFTALVPAARESPCGDESNHQSPGNPKIAHGKRMEQNDRRFEKAIVAMP
jgi:hypothetical protein